MASQVCLATTTFDLTAPQQMLRMRSKYAEMAYTLTTLNYYYKIEGVRKPVIGNMKNESIE